MVAPRSKNGEYALALVTGGAHRLGRSFALTLAHLGYAIVLHYHKSEKAANSTADEIRASGVPVFLVRADLTQLSDIQSLYQTLDSLNLQLKILVNSAARLVRSNLREVSVFEWDATVGLNLRAPFIMAQKASERMVEGGLIINITDAAAGKTRVDFPAYLVSKAGLEVLTRLLAKTYAPNIRVNAIAPGLVLPSAATSEKEWTILVNRLPLKRPASTEDISSALGFLLKNESITGQTIAIDSGYSLL